MKKRLSLYLLGLLAALPGLAQAAYPDDLRLLSYNVYMLSTNLYPNWGQSQRADLIAQADFMRNHDVLLLQELFDNSASDRLLNNLKSQYPYQTPVLGRARSGWDATLGAYSDTRPEDGGAAIVSKWPIEEKIQYVYTQGCGADAMSNKGFVYVRIRKNGFPYHLISTHAQAVDSSCAEQTPGIRQSQFTELRTFLQGKNIPASEAIFLGGDFNVIRGSSEYTQMLATLDVYAPDSYAGAAATWDPTTNGIARYNYPDAPAEYLDYVFAMRGHAKPSYWHNQALDPASPRWQVSSGGTRYQYKDYSDHYPVAAFAYADAGTRTQSYKSQQNRYGNLAIESVANGKAIVTGSYARDWLRATGSSSQAGSRFSMRNWYYPITSCVNSGDFIEVEANAYPGHWWNWYAGLGGGYRAWYPEKNDSSDTLSIVNLSRPAGECLQDGDTVAFMARVGLTDYYVKRWPSGSWANHIYVWSSSIGTDEKFRVRLFSQPVYQDWRPYLRY